MLARRLLPGMLALLMAGCGIRAAETTAEAPPSQPPQTLEQAQALWGAHRVSSYQVTVTQTCFCPPDVRQPIRVTVEAGEITHFEGLEQPLQAPEQLDPSRLTVSGLFDFIKQAEKRDPHKLEVEYDSTHGFPRRIDYDGHPMIADDEFQYELRDFRAGLAD